MTDHPIKLTLLNVLLLCCLQGVLAGAALASDISLEQEGAPQGKRKSLHEYGPEDVHPEAREAENSARTKRQALQPKARNIAPTAPRSDAPAQALTSTTTVTPAPAAPSAAGSSVTPVITPAVTPTPAPVESSAPAAAKTRSEPQKVKSVETNRRKLLVSLSIFLLLFAALVFFAIKMWRQLRAGGPGARERASQEQLPAVEKRQLRIVGQGAPEKRVKQSDINPKGLKTKAQDERGARFKKA
ncbi:MAG TPA: hypothetical protein VJ810_41925 [Blastocatellia bacterium]|nr:hypothetical protein [Blastocatellia bacterium]